ncbi:MAG: hypothetical protein R2798_08625 [Chitinophagales bacterium]|nr:hypothetical protein [Bacteroidota bacterium]MCB9043981.1 hypothetical protein [Chitinophagales bacterium]
MKYSKYLLTLVFIFLIASCGKEEYVQYTQGEGQKIVDPYLQVITSVVPFQAGVESYDISFNVLNGTKSLSDVEVYKQFTDASSGQKSDKVLLKSYAVGALKTEVNDVINYTQLKENLTVGGSALPEDESLLAIGSGWVLTFVGVYTNGGAKEDLGGAINVGVLSPYAGLYEVIESDYWRVGVQSGIADWTGQERFIGSVDENTFSYNDWWGPFEWSGGSFNFKVDLETNEITVPIIVNGLFSGNRALGCDTEPEMFANVPCAGSDMLVKDPNNPNAANGAHEITITYGYFTDGSGPREFYEKLRKKN